MHIVVIGAGGQGGYLGGCLSRAGENVSLIARGSHLKAIQNHGLTLKSEKGKEINIKLRATDNYRQVKTADLILFCVKNYDLESAVEQAGSIVTAKTSILTVQNGIFATDYLSQVFGSENILGGVSYLAGRIEKFGVIIHGGVAGKLYVGELNGRETPRITNIMSVLKNSGIDTEIHRNINIAIWEKMILICASGGVMAMMRLPMGEILKHQASTKLFLGVMTEAEKVARASGIKLAADIVDQLFNFCLTKIDPATQSSQLTDLLGGWPLELEYLNGTIVRLGEKFHVPTPLNFAVYAALKPYAKGSCAHHKTKTKSD